MPEEKALKLDELSVGEMKVVTVGGSEILLIHHENGFAAVQPKCPHAGAPLEEGAICHGRLICPWHLGTFALPSGELLEPPPRESLKTYAVRVENEGIFVNSDPQQPVHMPVRQSSSNPVFLIVGGGAAGSMAATTLRQYGFGGRIVVVEPVAEEPVDRTQLSKDALAGKMPLDKIGLDSLSSIDVEVIRAKVVVFSSGKREVHLSNGSILHFDKAFIATGGSPKRLNVPGAELARTIRHPQDVAEIQNSAKGIKTVVIIGTSFIGMEAASALVQSGLTVTVIGKEELPFSKQFGDRVAKALMAAHTGNGTWFCLGVKVEQIDSASVRIRVGNATEIVPADLVIMGVGVTPELSFEHDLPLATGGGVQTNETLRIGESVWVGGDIAEVNGTRIEHWRVAEQHGRVAALGMVGTKARHEGVPYFWTYHFGRRLGYLGRAEDWDDLTVYGDLAELDFIALYTKQGKVKAVLNCGFEKEMAALAEMMRGPLVKDDALYAIRTAKHPDVPLGERTIESE